MIISYYMLAAQADECWFLNIDVSLYFDEYFIINKKGTLFLGQLLWFICPNFQIQADRRRKNR